MRQRQKAAAAATPQNAGRCRLPHGKRFQTLRESAGAAPRRRIPVRRQKRSPVVFHLSANLDDWTLEADDTPDRIGKDSEIRDLDSRSSTFRMPASHSRRVDWLAVHVAKSEFRRRQVNGYCQRSECRFRAPRSCVCCAFLDSVQRGSDDLTPTARHRSVLDDPNGIRLAQLLPIHPDRRHFRSIPEHKRSARVADFNSGLQATGGLPVEHDETPTTREYDAEPLRTSIQQPCQEKRPRIENLRSFSLMSTSTKTCSCLPQVTPQLDRINKHLYDVTDESEKALQLPQSIQTSQRRSSLSRNETASRS